MARPSNQILIAGVGYPIDWPTVNMHDPGGFDAHTLGCATGFAGAQACRPDGTPRQPAQGLAGKRERFRPRRSIGGERTLAAAQAVITQFVVHLDGCLDAGMCFDVLHNERGLSCHFILDNDGTIYQTLDLIDCAYHAAGLNETSIGIEMCNRGNAGKEPHYYERYPHLPRRDQVVCVVNGETYVAFDFTPQQLAAMEVLGKRLARLLPGIKLDYPQSSPGIQSWDTIDVSGARYSGYLGHYHITNQKWDPGPFDFKRFTRKLAGRRSFPIGLHGAAAEIPEDPPARVFEAYYENDERGPDRAGGHFPTGPLETSQLWHGGVHLFAPDRAPVVAPLAGQVVAARNAPPDKNVGSTSFVLVRHRMRVGGEAFTVFTLLYHLAEETGERPAWMASREWRDREPGHTVVFERPTHVQAGDLVGHVGQAGPSFRPQIHWELFAADPGPIARLDRHGFWHEVSGAADLRVCTSKEVLAHLGDAAWTRSVVAAHASDWADRPDWRLALRNAPELVARGRAGVREADQMFEEQIEPGLWLTGDVPSKLGLPVSAPLYFYHPVSFLRFVNALLAAPDAGGPRIAKAEDYRRPLGSKMLDIDDREGRYCVEEKEPPPARKLELDDMIEGYPD